MDEWRKLVGVYEIGTNPGMAVFVTDVAEQAGPVGLRQGLVGVGPFPGPRVSRHETREDPIGVEATEVVRLGIVECDQTDDESGVPGIEPERLVAADDLDQGLDQRVGGPPRQGGVARQLRPVRTPVSGAGATAFARCHSSDPQTGALCCPQASSFP